MARSTKGRSLAVLALSTALGLSACGSSHHSATSPSTTTTAPTSSTSSTTPGPTVTTPLSVVPSTSSTSAPSVTAQPGSCSSTELGGTLTNPNGAAGTIYYTIVLTNDGSTTCTMAGYPGVSFVTLPGGSQVGAAASRTSTTTPALVSLAPGRSADVTLGIAEAVNFPNCQATPVQGLRLYPPGQTGSLVIPHTDTACANAAAVTLHVGPVTAAA